MGSFEDFIRYGLPGYLFIGSFLFGLFNSGIILISESFLKQFATILGAALIIVGPLIGFLIHQIYFAYFDWRESYDKLTRGCISFIYHSFLDSKKFKPDVHSKNEILDNSFVAWKFLTTNFEDYFKIEQIFLSRLRNLRNYSHAFGAIFMSSIISFFTTIPLFIVFSKYNYLSLGFVISHLLIMVLFYSKRKDLIKRINEIEIGIALKNKKIFVDYVSNLLKLENKNRSLLKKARNG